MIQDDTQATRPQAVRLVVWNLDDTFWHGTLSEGGITYRRELHDVVVALARRGIVSSICSKNDPAPVGAELERQGIWDHFVFSSIDWSAKGRGWPPWWTPCSCARQPSCSSTTTR